MCRAAGHNAARTARGLESLILCTDSGAGTAAACNEMLLPGIIAETYFWHENGICPKAVLRVRLYII